MLFVGSIFPSLLSIVSDLIFVCTLSGYEGPSSCIYWNWKSLLCLLPIFNGISLHLFLFIWEFMFTCILCGCVFHFIMFLLLIGHNIILYLSSSIFFKSLFAIAFHMQMQVDLFITIFLLNFQHD